MRARGREIRAGQVNEKGTGYHTQINGHTAWNRTENRKRLRAVGHSHSIIWRGDARYAPTLTLEHEQSLLVATCVPLAVSPTDSRSTINRKTPVVLVVEDAADDLPGNCVHHIKSK